MLTCGTALQEATGDNNMLGMGTAYRVDRSGGRFVDILSNTMSTAYHGMELRANDGAAHILVEGNDITFGGDASCTACKGYTAIQVTEGNMDNTDSKILGNTIHFLPQNASRFGIFMNAANDWLVAGNTLQMADNTHNRTGIQLSGCNRPEVSCNTVKGATNGYPQDVQAAIRNAMGSDVLISCNDVDSTANGIMFNYVAPNTDVRGNKMRHHKWGLHLDGTAVIGLQELKGNLWYQQPAAGGLGAWYEGDSTNVLLYPFRYNPGLISGGNTQPPSVFPNGWFSVLFGANYDCADDEGEDYCTLFKMRGTEHLTELDVAVASDSLENDPYTDETKWMLRGRLYKKLNENPELLDSLHVMADLYDVLQGTSTADFTQIDDEQLHLYELDSAVLVQLQQNQTQVDSITNTVKEELEQLNDSALTSAQLQAIIAGLCGYRQNIHDLSQWNASALQVASATKEAIADAVKATNAGIVSSALIEANERTVNDIYLSTIAKGVDDFTNDQSLSLFDIANQCPMLGGEAVFKARSLYWLIDDGYDFDDASLCLPYDIVVKRLTMSDPNPVMMIPNPTMNEATLVLMMGLDQPGILIIYDAIGTEVLLSSVPAATMHFGINTASLAPALYYYKVLSQVGVLGSGRLSIVR